MTVKEWLKKNKEELVFTGSLIGIGVMTYFIAKDVKNYSGILKRTSDLKKEEEAILNMFANAADNIQDLPKPDWPIWHVAEFWTEKDRPGSVCAIMAHMPIADIGTLGEKLISDCGAPLNAVVDLTLSAYQD